MAWNVEWTLFTVIAISLLAIGYRQTEKLNERMLMFAGSFLFWLASIWQWVVDQTGTNSLMLVLVLIAPLMLSFAWFMQALGAYVDRINSKADYNEY